MANIYVRVSNTSGSSGTGNVVGPGSSLNNQIAVFDGTDGTIIKTSIVTIDALGNIITSGEITIQGTAVKATLDDYETRISTLEGASASKYVQTFVTGDWVLNSDYELDILQSIHLKGTSPTVQVYEANGLDFDEVNLDVFVAANGDVKLTILSSPDLRFSGKLIIL